MALPHHAAHLSTTSRHCPYNPEFGLFPCPSPRSPLEKNPFYSPLRGTYTPQNLQIEEISRSLPPRSPLEKNPFLLSSKGGLPPLKIKIVITNPGCHVYQLLLMNAPPALELPFNAIIKQLALCAHSSFLTMLCTPTAIRCSFPLTLPPTFSPRPTLRNLPTCG